MDGIIVIRKTVKEIALTLLIFKLTIKEKKKILHLFKNTKKDVEVDDDDDGKKNKKQHKPIVLNNTMTFDNVDCRSMIIMMVISRIK